MENTRGVLAVPRRFAVGAFACLTVALAVAGAPQLGFASTSPKAALTAYLNGVDQGRQPYRKAGQADLATKSVAKVQAAFAATAKLSTSINGLNTSWKTAAIVAANKAGLAVPAWVTFGSS
jgi:hypothetical protein